MNRPIFKNISQALHFSFAMEYVPASVKSLNEYSAGNVYGHSRSNIDFGNLTPEEVRAQCATVRAMVNDHLLSTEKNAVWARYGWYERKYDGIKGIAVYVEPESRIKGDVLLDLACNFYGLGGYSQKGGKLPPLSLRDIADKYEIPTTNLFRVKRLIANRSVELELLAFGRLNELNVLNGRELAGVE